MLDRFSEMTVLLACLVAFFLLWITLSTAWFLLFRKIRKLENKLERFFTGKSGQDLESVLLETKSLITSVDSDVQELFNISNEIHRLAHQGIHRHTVLRFNPFKENGGNQSFAVALLDGRNNGIVLSSLHTREGTRVFAKPVKHGDADGYPLTEEEKAAVREAEKRVVEKKV